MKPSFISGVVIVALLVCLFICMPLGAATSNNLVGNEIVGIWLTEGGSGKIKVYRCGKKYCGKTIWIKPTKEFPHPENKRDVNNPNEKKRNNKLLGSTIMWGLTFNPEKNNWENGSIYDPGRGKVFSCKLKLENNRKTLLLRGYLGLSFIGKTTRWTRVDEK